jgi:hypothetical protein
MNPEQQRLRDHYQGKAPWLHWGPYLAERQWGTVREDYSHNGDAWHFFSHDHARSRAYRWGEDGLAGFSDDQSRLCFGLGLWNGQDSILKERLFGLTGPEGNHGEDVKELYYYLDGTPSHSYLKFLYKYPQAAFPYDELLAENRCRSKQEPEYELLDTGVFDEGRYFDVLVEYAQAAPDDLCIRITVSNRGPESAPIWVLPQLWFRNTWRFGLLEEKPLLRQLDVKGYAAVEAIHPELGRYQFSAEPPEHLLFTENDTNHERLFGTPNDTPFTKDAFHTAVVRDAYGFLAGNTQGTKCAPVYQAEVPAGESVVFRLRLAAAPADPFLPQEVDQVFAQRIAEADAYYDALAPTSADDDTRNIQRQAFAGLIWTKQYYYYDIPQWLQGDPTQLTPPPQRFEGRNAHWQHLNNADILSMPDKWEYPWYAAWDLAFHCVPLAMIDSDFAKQQLLLMLREWYMHPNGQIPAYEWNFSDVNPPVHAWAAWEVYQQEKRRSGQGDLPFLKRVFHKLLLNFTWWVNRKDTNGNNVFEGGFLGLDNIGVFDRSADLPGGGHLEQADGTAWMGAYCLHMLQIALELSCYDETYEDLATKFLEHFTFIAETLNHLHDGDQSMWDEDEGFYFDKLILPDGRHFPVKVRSLVGLAPVFAVMVIPADLQAKVPAFMERLNWFRQYRQGIGKTPLFDEKANGDLLLALVPRERLERLLTAMLDEDEFLAPGGIRSLSKRHQQQPYSLHINGEDFGLRYEPGESTTRMFGGNSNWRGPVWLPMNYMLIRALDHYHDFYEEMCLLHLPAAFGRTCSLREIGDQLAHRLISMFRPDQTGQRPIHQPYEQYRDDPHFQKLILFYEYFHGDHSRGVGASHQTGWTALVAELIERVGQT